MHAVDVGRLGRRHEQLAERALTGFDGLRPDAQRDPERVLDLALHRRGDRLPREEVAHLGRVHGGEQAADDRDAERPTELARGVVDRRAHPGLAEGQRAHDRLGGRGHRDRHAHHHQHHRAQDLEVRRVDLHGRDEADAEARDHQSEAHDDLGPESAHEARAQRGEDDHGQRGGEERETRLHRRVPQHELEVLRDEEREPEQREEHEHHREARGAEAGVPEEPDVEHRVVGVQLPHEEPAEDHQARRRWRRGSSGRSSPAGAPR